MAVAQFAPVGNFCWPELATTDSTAAKVFYGALFGWSSYDVPTAAGFYTIFQVDGLDAAAAYQMGPQQTAPPHWNSYVVVASADATCAEAETLGAHILMAPFDIPNVGRMAFLRDPGGASIALWQSGEHHGAGVFDRPGALCWTELKTRDTEQAAAFYTALFGWRAVPQADFGMPYTMFYQGEEPVGGMMGMEGTNWANVPSAWMPYIVVPDVEAVAGVAIAHGGRLLVPPTEIPTAGRFAMVKDRQGAAISFIQLAEG